jgi:enamine deaminase RidA (YjgF/YER057c/UK114 family)
MTGKRIFSGHRFEKMGGYARAVVEDGWVFHSGTTGFDWATDTIAADIEGQTRRMLENVKWALPRRVPRSRMWYGCASTSAMPRTVWP